MYAGARQTLFSCSDNPHLHLLHFCFHVLFVMNFILVFLLRFQDD